MPGGEKPTVLGSVVHLEGAGLAAAVGRRLATGGDDAVDSLVFHGARAHGTQQQPVDGTPLAVGGGGRRGHVLELLAGKVVTVVKVKVGCC